MHASQFAKSTISLLAVGAMERQASVIGVTSAVTFGTDGEVSAGAIVRLDLHRSWIAQGAREAAERGGYRAPRWARDCD